LTDRDGECELCSANQCRVSTEQTMDPLMGGNGGTEHQIIFRTTGGPWTGKGVREPHPAGGLGTGTKIFRVLQGLSGPRQMTHDCFI
jgi:hypothetical protein